MGVILPISFFFVCPARSVQCAITATDSSAEPVQTMPRREKVHEYEKRLNLIVPKTHKRRRDETEKNARVLNGFKNLILWHIIWTDNYKPYY